MTERIMAPNQQNQDFYLQGLNDAREETKARIAALEKKPAALDWSPITDPTEKAMAMRKFESENRNKSKRRTRWSVK